MGFSILSELCNHDLILEHFPQPQQKYSFQWSFTVPSPSFQFSSVAQLCPTLCDPMNLSTPGRPVHHQLLSSLRLRSIKSVMPSSHFILCRPLLLLPPIPPSIRVFSNESTLRTRWPKYWSFSFSISPSKETFLYYNLVCLSLDLPVLCMSL